MSLARKVCDYSPDEFEALIVKQNGGGDVPAKAAPVVADKVSAVAAQNDAKEASPSELLEEQILIEERRIQIEQKRLELRRREVSLQKELSEVTGSN